MKTTKEQQESIANKSLTISELNSIINSKKLAYLDSDNQIKMLIDPLFDEIFNFFEEKKTKLIIPESGPFSFIVDMQSPTRQNSSKKYDWNGKQHFENWENAMTRRGFKIIGYHNIEENEENI